MIKINFHKENNLITLVKIFGHANAGKNGEDLICSAVSAVSTGILNAIDNLEPLSCEIEVDKNGLITIFVKENNKNLQLILKTLWYQLLTIAQQYPDYILLKEV